MDWAVQVEFVVMLTVLALLVIGTAVMILLKWTVLPYHCH